MSDTGYPKRTPRPDGANAYLITSTGPIWCEVLVDRPHESMVKIVTYRRRVKNWSKLKRWVLRDRVVRFKVCLVLDVENE